MFEIKVTLYILDPLVLFLCTALGLILFAPRLKMMLCVCGSCCVLDVGCSYLDAFGKLKQRKPCRGRALVDEIHVDDVCDVDEVDVDDVGDVKDVGDVM